MDDNIGQQLGNYRLVSLVGQGAFAKVYVAEHVLLHNKVAIKLLDRHVDYESSEQFLSEARFIANLTHPHIVRIFDFNFYNDTPYIVEEYAPNGTLRQKHPKGTKLPLDTVIKYTEQITEALQYAHDNKVIHRDVKPENMLLGSNQEILLSDFGIATVSKTAPFQSLLDVAGTVAYMAPEQLRGQPRRASDQYSLSIVIYEWLSGAYPFHGSFSEIARQHLFATPESLQQKVPGLPRHVEEVLFIALAKEPERRFSSIRAFSNALKQANQGYVAIELSSSSSFANNAVSVTSDDQHMQFIEQKESQIHPPPPLPETTPPIKYPSNWTDASVETSPPSGPFRPPQPLRRKRVALLGIALPLLLVASLLGALLVSGILPIGHNTNCKGLSDHFQQKDLGGWTWEDPSGASTYDFDNPEHYLHIYSPGTADEDLNPNNNTNAPRLLQPVDGDFSIETQIHFLQQPATFQGAAILIWQSQSKFIRLEISAWDNKYYGVNFVYYDVSDPKGNFHDLGSKLLATPPSVKLRLERRGAVFSAAWQQGTGAWNTIDKMYTMTAGPVGAGLVLMNSAILHLNQRPAEALFYYFHFSCLN